MQKKSTLPLKVDKNPLQVANTLLQQAAYYSKPLTAVNHLLQ